MQQINFRSDISGMFRILQNAGSATTKTSRSNESSIFMSRKYKKCNNPHHKEQCKSKIGGSQSAESAVFKGTLLLKWSHVQLLQDNYRPHLIHILLLIQQIHHSLRHRTLSLPKEDVSFSTSGYGGPLDHVSTTP